MAAGGMNTTQYQNMMRAMPNGVPTNDLKRAAAMNNRPYVFLPITLLCNYLH